MPESHHSNLKTREITENDSRWTPAQFSVLRWADNEWFVGWGLKYCEMTWFQTSRLQGYTGKVWCTLCDWWRHQECCFLQSSLNTGFTSLYIIWKHFYCSVRWYFFSVKLRMLRWCVTLSILGNGRQLDTTPLLKIRIGTMSAEITISKWTVLVTVLWLRVDTRSSLKTLWRL